MKVKEIKDMPTLEEYEKVVEFIKRYDGQYTLDELWKKIKETGKDEKK